MDVTCSVCGDTFQAKRASAKYCKERCRKRAQRAPSGPPETPPTLAVVVPLPGHGVPLAGQDDESLYDATLAELVTAGRERTAMGRTALLLARRLDAPTLDTGSSIASLVREHRAALAAAVAGAVKTESPLERLRGRDRARRVGGT